MMGPLFKILIYSYLPICFGIDNSLLKQLLEENCPNTPAFSKYFVDNALREVNVCTKGEDDRPCQTKKVINFYSRWEKCFDKIIGPKWVRNFNAIQLQNLAYIHLRDISQHNECSTDHIETLIALNWTTTETDYFRKFLYKQIMIYPVSFYNTRPSDPNAAKNSCEDIIPGRTKLANFDGTTTRLAIKEADEECKKYGNKMGCQISVDEDPNYYFKDGKFVKIRDGQNFYGRALCRVDYVGYGSACAGQDVPSTDTRFEKAEAPIAYKIENGSEVLASYYDSYFREAVITDISETANKNHYTAIYQDLAGNKLYEWSKIESSWINEPISREPAKIAKNIIPRHKDIQRGQMVLFKLEDNQDRLFRYSSSRWNTSAIGEKRQKANGEGYHYDSADKKYLNYDIEDIRLLANSTFAQTRGVGVI